MIETSDFDQLVQMPKSRQAQRPLSPRSLAALELLQPEEERPLHTRCRRSGTSFRGQPQVAGFSSAGLSPRRGRDQPRRSTGT